MNELENKLEQAFKEYVYKYDMNDENISRKYFHSLRVKDFAKEIAMYEKLPPEEVKLSIIIGILHDYARFEQWKKYKTYNDVNSIDHGDLAITLLFDNKEIYNFYDEEADFYKIKLAIKYHNKIKVPATVKNDELMLCNIIRDADKLDIFNLKIQQKSLFAEDDKEISSNIKEKFFDNNMINYKDLKSKNDKIILTLAMFYDINSDFSYKYIVKNQIIEKLFDKIEDKEKYKKYFEHITEFVENRLENIQ